MIYTNPTTVLSPRRVISDLNVIFDGGNRGVSVATMRWDGRDVIGIRWNIAMNEWNDPLKIANQKVCLGMPVAYGKPVWYILPPFDNCDDEVKQKVKELLKL